MQNRPPFLSRDAPRFAFHDLISSGRLISARVSSLADQFLRLFFSHASEISARFSSTLGRSKNTAGPCETLTPSTTLLVQSSRCNFLHVGRARINETQLPNAPPFRVPFSGRSVHDHPLWLSEFPCVFHFSTAFLNSSLSPTRRDLMKTSERSLLMAESRKLVSLVRVLLSVMQPRL